MNHNEEEDEGNPITQEILTQLIKKQNLYMTPSLNEILYLHQQGFTKISSLGQFINLKTLWLNNNAISTIEGLDELKHLVTLNLSNNLIDKISGLDNLTNLNSLILSNNYISKIEGLDNCKSLKDLQIDHNKIKNSENLSGLLKAPSIEILNLNNNMIDDENSANILIQLTNLRVLRMSGNDCIKKIKNYRRLFVSSLPNLKYLDEAPVDYSERRIVDAWKVGGSEAEMKVRNEINHETEAFHKQVLDEYDELIKQGKLERGEPLEDSENVDDVDDQNEELNQNEENPNIVKPNIDEID